MFGRKADPTPRERVGGWGGGGTFQPHVGLLAPLFLSQVDFCTRSAVAVLFFRRAAPAMRSCGRTAGTEFFAELIGDSLPDSSHVLLREECYQVVNKAGHEGPLVGLLLLDAVLSLFSSTS